MLHRNRAKRVRKLARGLTWFHFGLVVLAIAIGCNRPIGDPLQASSSAEATQAADEDPSQGPELNWEEQIRTVRESETTSIRLQSSQVTDADLSLLDDPLCSQNLKELLLDQGVVSDAGMRYIANLSELEHLRLRDSLISDTGIQVLSDGSLSQLRILNLPQASVTAVGVGQLQKFSSLTQLRLGGSQIDDMAVAAIAELDSLRSLHLIGPRISAAALKSLAAMKNLGSFYLDDCPLPDGAWEELFRAKPNLHVHIDQLHHDRDPQLGH